MPGPSVIETWLDTTPADIDTQLVSDLFLPFQRRPRVFFRRDDAGVVYVASLLFDESMMALLAQRVQRLRPGARILSLKPIPAPESSRELTGPRDVGVREGDKGVRQDSRDSKAAGIDPGLRLLHEGVFRMSWQMARVYIYVRL